MAKLEQIRGDIIEPPKGPLYIPPTDPLLLPVPVRKHVSVSDLCYENVRCGKCGRISKQVCDCDVIMMCVCGAAPTEQEIVAPEPPVYHDISELYAG